MTGLSLSLTVLDYAAVAVFGATGALTAARQKQDIVTFAFFAAVTGVGGGTLRDLLIGAPVFWTQRPGYLLVCLAAAVAVWLLRPKRFRVRILIWLDAVGMAAYAIVGAAKAQSLGEPHVVAVVMGVLTATFGGVIRDVLAHEPSVLLQRELYVTPALAGATVFVVLGTLGAPTLAAGVLGFLTAFVIRAGAILWGWSLPGFGGAGEREGLSRPILFRRKQSGLISAPEALQVLMSMFKRAAALLTIGLMFASAAQAQSGGGGRGHGGGGGRGGHPQGAARPPAAAPAKPFTQPEIVGVVKAVDLDTGRVTIAYEAVEALDWPAGAQPFPVSKAALLRISRWARRSGSSSRASRSRRSGRSDRPA